MRETDAEFGQMHDRWLANYQHRTEEVWCSNPKCDNYEDGLDVLYEEEFGAGWTTPDECPRCGSELLFDKPDPIEEEEE